MEETALKTYRERRGNCAQAVSLAWTERTGRNAELFGELALCGSGRAPGGICGAVHALYRIAPADQHQALARKFQEKSGGLLGCKEIRSLGILSCLACVGTAAALLETLAD